MKFFQAINNFASGEWSKKMFARTDTQQYQAACETLKNAIVQIQGGAFMRPGTAYLKMQNPALQTALNAASEVRLIPFVVFGINYILVIPDGAVGNWFLVNDNGVEEPIVNVSGPTLDAHLLNADQVRTIQYVQTGNTLILTVRDADIPPIVLAPATSGLSTVINMYSWCVKNNGSGYLAYSESVGIKRWEAVPYGPFQSNKTKGSVVITGAASTVGSAVGVAFPIDVFFPLIVTFRYPQYLRVTAAAKTMVIELTHKTTTNPRVCEGVVVYNPDAVAVGTFGTASGTAWELGDWGVLNFPGTVTTFEQRLYFGYDGENPETVWGSTIGNIARFMRVPYLQDADFSTYASDNSYPFSFTLASKKAGQIVAMSSAKSLTIHTDAGEQVAYTANGSALGALNISIDSSTSFGSEKVQPYRINNFLTFVQKTGRKLRDLVFSFEQDQYKSTDLSFVADHLTYGADRIDNIVELCKVEDPSSVLFARTAEGRLRAVALDRDYQVNAWSTVEIGGALSVKAFCVLPSATAGDNIYREYAYFLVEREVDGNSVKYIERLSAMYESTDTGTLLPPIYMDSTAFSTLGGLGSTIIDNLDHLEGETVFVIADGQYLGEFVVDGGEVDCGREYTIGYAGIPYELVITPLPIEAGTQLGSSIGITKRIDEVTIRFWNTYGCEYGVVDGEMIEIDFKDPEAAMNAPVQLFTGDKRVEFPSGYDRRPQVTIRQRKPWPCNVLAVVSRGVTYD